MRRIGEKTCGLGSARKRAAADRRRAVGRGEGAPQTRREKGALPRRLRGRLFPSRAEGAAGAELGGKPMRPSVAGHSAGAERRRGLKGQSFVWCWRGGAALETAGQSFARQLRGRASLGAAVAEPRWKQQRRSFAGAPCPSFANHGMVQTMAWLELKRQRFAGAPVLRRLRDAPPRLPARLAIESTLLGQGARSRSMAGHSMASVLWPWYGRP